METAYLAESANRTSAQVIIDDRGQRHVSTRWIPESVMALYSNPSFWWSDARLRKYFVIQTLFWLGLVSVWLFVPKEFVSEYLAFYIFIGFVVLMALVRPAREGQRSSTLIERTFFPKGSCRNCLESLAGLDADADGCVTCPNCSAAWRANAQSL